MVIDPEVEKPTRRMLGHAVRGELDEFTSFLTGLAPERISGCLTLCLRLSAYIVIDICGHKWPTDADLREIAQRTAATDLDFNPEQQDAYFFLADSALGFKPLPDAFTENQDRVIDAGGPTPYGVKMAGCRS